MSNKLLAILLIGSFLLSGCSLSFSTLPTPTEAVAPTLVFITTETPSTVPQATDATAFTPTVISTSAATPILSTPIPPIATNICDDAQAITLIDSLKKAILTSDGELLSSLVSPNGMEVRWVRYGNPVTYTPDQAKFLFETTFEADWGAEPGSGQEKMGAFHHVIVPDFVKVFNHQYTLHCNEIKHGGASYDMHWPYNKDFYSIYDEGTQQNGNMDWRTWVAGIEYVNGKPFIYALAL